MSNIMANQIGYFKDKNGNRLFLGETFSTSECKTGMKWIDGKDIYMRVFTNTFTEVYNPWYKIGNIPNIDTLIMVNGAVRQSADGNWINFPRCTTANGEESVDFYCGGSDGGIWIRIHKATGDLHVVCWYTKK